MLKRHKRGVPTLCCGFVLFCCCCCFGAVSLSLSHSLCDLFLCFHEWW